MRILMKDVTRVTLQKRRGLQVGTYKHQKKKKKNNLKPKTVGATAVQDR